jgi:hypothetical protein
MGALFFSNETYRETLPIIDASGLPSIPFNHNTKNWLYEYKSGHIQRSNSSISKLTSHHSFQAEIDRYIHFWKTEFAPLATIGYKVTLWQLFGPKFKLTGLQNGVKGYTMTTFDWLLENKYPLLLFLFVEGMVPYGYGDVRQVPAVGIFNGSQILI